MIFIEVMFPITSVSEIFEFNKWPTSENRQLFINEYFKINGINHIIFLRCFGTFLFMLRIGSSSPIYPYVLHYNEGKSRQQDSRINETI